MTTVTWLDRTMYPFSSQLLALRAGRMHYVDEGRGDAIFLRHDRNGPTLLLRTGPRRAPFPSIDPNYARSYALLADTYNTVWVNRLDGDHLNPAALERALQLARKAVELDPYLPEAHAVLGFVFTWLHQHDASVAEFERAIALNPNYADWRFGWTLVPAGDSRRAVDVLRASMRLDPFHGPLPLFFLGVAHFREYAQALMIARDFVAQAPVRPWGHALVAMIYAEMGAFEEAQAEAAEVLRLDSAFTVSRTAGSLAAFKESRDHEHFFGALRKTGLPD